MMRREGQLCGFDVLRGEFQRAKGQGSRQGEGGGGEGGIGARRAGRGLRGDGIFRLAPKLQSIRKRLFVCSDKTG